ncbi:MAG TPA: PilZ domain-containing protein [Myxococcota bacterium]|nr:PilZ domain-containing protein [Myxococcales bacterium]HPG25127.1 PilZ domain-containing protein [Myxococcota bacterium]
MGWLARRTDHDRLRSERVVPLRFAPVEVQIIGRGSLDVLRARNVSTTGLGVYVPHGFEGFDLAQEVELVVTLPGRRPFLARGVIKHLTASNADTRHFGLEFTELADRDRDGLLRYVRSRLG